MALAEVQGSQPIPWHKVAIGAASVVAFITVIRFFYYSGDFTAVGGLLLGLVIVVAGSLFLGIRGWDDEPVFLVTCSIATIAMTGMLFVFLASPFEESDGDFGRPIWATKSETTLTQSFVLAVPFTNQVAWFPSKVRVTAMNVTVTPREKPHARVTVKINAENFVLDTRELSRLETMLSTMVRAYDDPRHMLHQQVAALVYHGVDAEMRAESLDELQLLEASGWSTKYGIAERIIRGGLGKYSLRWVNGSIEVPTSDIAFVSD